MELSRLAWCCWWKTTFFSPHKSNTYSNYSAHTRFCTLQRQNHAFTPRSVRDWLVNVTVAPILHLNVMAPHYPWLSLSNWLFQVTNQSASYYQHFQGANQTVNRKNDPSSSGRSCYGEYNLFPSILSKNLTLSTNELHVHVGSGECISVFVCFCQRF